MMLLVAVNSYFAVTYTYGRRAFVGHTIRFEQWRNTGVHPPAALTKTSDSVKKTYRGENWPPFVV
jgi:hypothetical protein